MKLFHKITELISPKLRTGTWQWKKLLRFLNIYSETLYDMHISG